MVPCVKVNDGMVALEPLFGFTPDTLFEAVTIHDQVTLGVVLVMLIAKELCPLQILWLGPPVNCNAGAGITVMERVSGCPLQPAAFGVIK